MAKKLITLAGIGETRLLERLARILPPPPPDTLGVGDDAALVHVFRDTALVTTDALIDGTHFQRRWFRPEEVGYKALATSISDAVAMGGAAAHGFVSLALPGDLPVNAVERLYRGLRKAARAHEVSILGGNVARAESIAITMTLLGFLRGEAPFLRSGARPGDRIYVSGQPGLARLGLAVLRRTSPEPARKHPDLWSPPATREPEWRRRAVAGAPGARAALRRFLTPEPRVQLSRDLRLFRPTALIDVSDGLAADLVNLARPGARLVLDPALLPRSPSFVRLAGALGLDVDAVLWGGGEDYELLFTLGPAASRRLGDRGTLAGVPVTRIGEVAAGAPGAFVRVGSRERAVPRESFEHFA